MKYEQIDNKLFIENREKFKKQLKPNSIAIFTSNYEYVLNGDANHTFKQNSNLFWLCGIDQEDSILVIYPDCAVEEFRECLFLKQTNEKIAVWEGYKYTKEHATQVSGIKNIHWNEGFWDKIRPIINMAKSIYLPLNENDRFAYKAPYNELDFVKEVKNRFPLHHFERSSTHLQNFNTRNPLL